MAGKLLVFDLDDTLYLERDYISSGFEAVGDYVEVKLGIPGFAFLANQIFDSGHKQNVFDEVFTRLGVVVAQGTLSELVEVYRNHTPKISLDDRVREMLFSLGRENKIAIVTDGFATAQRLKIDALGIDYLFDEIVVTGEHPQSWKKPGTQAFKFLQFTFGAQSAGCFYVADNPLKDFQGPLSLGWEVARIRPKGGVYSHVSTPMGIREFASLGLFQRWLKSLRK